MKRLKILATTLGVVATTSLLWHSQARADAIDHYQPAYFHKAEQALEQQQPEKALALLTGRLNGLRHTSYKAAGYDLVCRAHYQLGDYATAEEACSRAVSLGGGASAWSYVNNRGVMRLVQGKVQEALTDFEQAASLNPKAISVRKNAELARRELNAAAAIPARHELALN